MRFGLAKGLLWLLGKAEAETDCDSLGQSRRFLRFRGALSALAAASPPNPRAHDHDLLHSSLHFCRFLTATRIVNPQSSRNAISMAACAI